MSYRGRMSNECLVVLCTCPERQDAERIAHAVVDRRIAACVNVLPGVSSIYRWERSVDAAEEVLMVIKTTRARYASLQDAIVSLHPYEVPEIVALPVTVGLPAYLAWLAESAGVSDRDG